MTETTMAELMQRDPLGLSAQDIDIIIQTCRKGRATFLLGDKKGGKIEKEPKKKLDLDQLDIKL